MSENQKQVIEINGIKMEIDLRHAKKIEHYKVGDNVKVLIKKYSDTFESYPGVIVGFDQFEKLPTINICYVEMGYSNAEIKYCHINANTKDHQIVHMQDYETLIDKQKAIDYLDRDIFNKQSVLDDAIRKRKYFVDKFNQHFEALEHDNTKQIEG